VRLFPYAKQENSELSIGSEVDRIVKLMKQSWPTHFIVVCSYKAHKEAETGRQSSNYGVSQKKQHSCILIITSANVDRFSKFFH